MIKSIAYAFLMTCIWMNFSSLSLAFEPGERVVVNEMIVPGIVLLWKTYVGIPSPRSPVISSLET